MKKHAFSSDQLQRLLDRTIDLFLEYQYQHGYEEPRARAEAVRAVFESLDEPSGPGEKS